MQMMDRYPHLVHVKGSAVQFKPEWLIFTSNTPPTEWYPKMMSDERTASAFNRRVYHVEEFIAPQIEEEVEEETEDPTPHNDVFMRIMNKMNDMSHVPELAYNCDWLQVVVDASVNYGFNSVGYATFPSSTYARAVEWIENKKKEQHQLEETEYLYRGSPREEQEQVPLVVPKTIKKNKTKKIMF